MEEVLLKSAVLDDKHRSHVRYYGDLGRGRQPKPAELAVAKAIFGVLRRHYPGHPWSVEVDVGGGWAKIGIIELLGPNWGMVVHLDSMTEAQVMDLAGQLLERFKMPRAGLDVAYYMSAQARVPLLGQFRAKDRHRLPT